MREGPSGPGRKRHVVSLVPNLITILALCSGMSGMRYAFDERWKISVALIVIAMVLDGLDGPSARLLKSTSKLGAQLDSLSDFVSFGVAPAVVVYLWCLNDVRTVGWALAMLFAACCALRLARFNVDAETGKLARWQAHFFKGVPAPAAAGMALLPLIASFSIGDAVARNWALNAFVMLGTALLMVSTLPSFSLKRLRIPQRYVLSFMILCVLVLVFLITETWATLTLIGMAYIASLPIAVRVAARMRQAEAADEDAKSS